MILTIFAGTNMNVESIADEEPEGIWGKRFEWPKGFKVSGKEMGK